MTSRASDGIAPKSQGLSASSPVLDMAGRLSLSETLSVVQLFEKPTAMAAYDGQPATNCREYAGRVKYSGLGMVLATKE